MKKNNKGFTLIELLAVIVVLAILILLAMPKVTSMMEKARKNSFAVEANEIVKIAQTAYSDGLLNGDSASGETCFTVDQLITDGFLDKDPGEIKGTITFDVDAGTGKYNTIVKLSKDSYYVEGTNTKFSGGEVKQEGNKVNKYAELTCSAGA